MKKTFSTAVIAVAAIVGSATAALGVTATMGNDAVDRSQVDTWSNFVVVDTNHPAPFDGTISSVDYYAERAGTIRFLIVDSANEVTWVSDEIAVGAAGPGSAGLAAPAGVTAGSNLAVYSEGAGVISFDFVGEPAEWQGFSSGLPAVGDTLTIVGTGGRTYSMSASVRASSPELCKNGGWESYGYRNQGQCIASVVANEGAGR